MARNAGFAGFTGFTWYRAVMRRMTAVMMMPVLLLLSAIFIAPVVMAPAHAQGIEKFADLARALGDAVLRSDDPATLELAARIRALGQPVGVEINFAEAQALLRMHRNDAARDAIARYLAAGGKLKSRAAAMRTELDRRDKALKTSWRRKIATQAAPYFYGDGTWMAVANTRDDLAKTNITATFSNAADEQQWRIVYGDTLANHVSDFTALDHGRFLIGGSTENGGWSDGSILTRPLLVALDPLGRVIWQLNPQNQRETSGNVFSGWVRFVRSDRRGGAIVAYSNGGQRVYIERYDADGVKKWRQFYAPPGNNLTLPSLQGLAVDPAGNVYVNYGRQGDVVERIIILDPDGAQRRVVTGNPIPKGRFLSDAGRFSADNLYRHVQDMVVADDGKTAFFLTDRPSGQNRQVAQEILAISLETGRQLWIRDVGPFLAVQGRTYYNTAIAAEGAGLVVAQTRPVAADGSGRRMIIRKFAGPRDVLVWERQGDGDPSSYGIKNLQLYPGGMFITSPLGGSYEIAHLAAPEFDGVDDPFADKPATAFWPYTENSDARVALVHARAQAALDAATQALAMCRAGKVSENTVGTIREVKSDWGFVIVDLQNPRGLRDDMLVRLADGSMIALKPGKQASPTAVSATPINAPIGKLAAGMTVVASGDIPDTLCPDELANLQSARGALSGLARPGAQ